MSAAGRPAAYGCGSHDAPSCVIAGRPTAPHPCPLSPLTRSEGASVLIASTILHKPNRISHMILILALRRLCYNAKVVVALIQENPALRAETHRLLSRYKE